MLVTGVYADGSTRDLTEKATATGSERVTLSDGLVIQGVADGAAVVKIEAEGLTADLPVTVAHLASDPPISFVRDVMPVLSRAGCNAGTCHGSAKGKKGFKLSLRGYDPDYDYAQLIDDLAGRRFNRSAPEQSLMLLKPSTSVPHEGGKVLEVGTPAYNLVRDWIAQGVASDVGKTSRVASLEILPRVIDLPGEGASQTVLAIAHFPDGSTPRRDPSSGVFEQRARRGHRFRDGACPGRPPRRGVDPGPL